MIGEEVLSSREVTLSEVKELLRKRKTERELMYEQEQTLKYATEFNKLLKAKRVRLLKALRKLESIDEALAVKIADILPAHMEIMQSLPSKESKATPEDLEKAFALVQQVRD